MPTRRRAFISGCTGQDGSYLAEQLLAKGYEVHGLIRRTSSFNTARIDHLVLPPQHATTFHLHHGDVTDGTSLRRVLGLVKPHEVYHLAAQSHVRVSFDAPESTLDVTALGTLRMLEAVKEICPEARFYQASSSEIFGSTSAPQNEDSPMRPRSPYGIAKLAGYHLAQNYRDAYGMYVVNGILFNHTSPRRGETFVERKITRAAARIAHKLQDHLYLGNLTARRDWGWAPEYMEAAWRMLQQDEPHDYVIGTGKMYSIVDVLDIAFGFVDVDWHDVVRGDPRYTRPTEVDELCADASRARASLGWTPTLTLTPIIEMMVEHDLDLARRER